VKRRLSRFLFPALALTLVSASASARCCVWRITNAKVPFYLVGSIHALNGNEYPLPAPYEQALRDSQRLLFEYNPNLDNEFSRKFETAAKYPPGQDIRTKVSPQTLAWLRDNTTAIHVNRGKDGQYYAMEKRFETALEYRPWYIAHHFFDMRGYADVSSRHGVDNYLARKAKKAGKQVAGLETPDEHVQVLSGLSDADAELMLIEQINHGYQEEKNFDQLRWAWRHGNTDKLWAWDARMRKEAPRIEARLLDDRNARWIPVIEHEIQTGVPTAIVAGALHFSGPNSVITMLRKRGYTIEQL